MVKITGIKRLDTEVGEDKSVEITIEYPDDYFKEHIPNNAWHGNRRFNLIVWTFANTVKELWFDETIKILEKEFNLDSITGDDIGTKQEVTYRTLLEKIAKTLTE